MKTQQRAPSIYPVVRYADPATAIRFLVDAFGFTEHEVHKGPDGDIAHAELSFGDGMVMLGPSAGPEAVFDTGAQSIYVVADDVDALHDRAIAAGAEIVYPLTDQDYGSRDFSAKDPAGNVWSFGTYRPTLDPGVMVGE
jgi:uncharacterized glyoxalase superfamily protein PhnB